MLKEKLSKMIDDGSTSLHARMNGWWVKCTSFITGQTSSCCRNVTDRINELIYIYIYIYIL